MSFLLSATLRKFLPVAATASLIESEAHWTYDSITKRTNIITFLSHFSAGIAVWA
jgi:hypothetical protein